MSCAMTRFKTCLYRLTMHPFTFHLPFPNHPNPIRKFLNIVAASFLINWALILSLYLCDRQGYLTRDDWTGKFAINVRPQRMDDAGCEYASDDRTNFLAQPVTSLSNFAFSFSGLIVLAFSYYDFLNMNTSHAPSQLIATHPLLSLFLAGTLCLMATTSFIWHASLATHGANIDFGAMYVLIGYIITLCLLRMLAYVPGWIGTRKLLAVAIHVVSFSGLACGITMYNIQTGGDEVISLEDTGGNVGYALDMNQNTLILLMILAIVGLIPLPLVVGYLRMAKNALLSHFVTRTALENVTLKRAESGTARRRRSWGLGILALLCIVVAKKFRDLDTGTACLEWWGPHSFMQAHAIWHCFCSFAVLFCYLFLRSEVFNLYAYNTKNEEGGGGEFWVEREERQGSDESSNSDGKLSSGSSKELEMV